jgi:hypothetical protein
MNQLGDQLMCSVLHRNWLATSGFAALLAFAAGNGHAATTTFVGGISDNAGSEVTQWRTASTVKTWDVDGNNVYGSSGYSIFRGDQGNGGPANWNTQILELQVPGLSVMQAGASTATAPLRVGNFNGATDWDSPLGGTRNMGYAGPRKAPASDGAVPLAQAFTYSVTQDFANVLRMGIASDGLGDSHIPLANLRVIAGGSQADATIVANPANSAPDMYFFDLNGLQSGDTIEIWMEGVIGADTSFSWPTINGVTFEQPLVPFLGARINRQTGAMTLDAENLSEPFNIVAYSIQSDAGALDPNAWTTISGHYDKVGNGGNGSFDPDDAWTRLTSPSSRQDLSEAEFDAINGAGNGAMLGVTNQSIDLGSAWIRNATEDLTFTIKLANGASQELQVQYTGDPIPVGDLNFDGVVTAVDWPIYRNGFGTGLSSLSVAESYQHGDLDGDGDNDENDFGLFKTAYESQPGNGSFATLIAQVPEPSSIVLLMLAGSPLLCRFTARHRSLTPSISLNSIHREKANTMLCRRFHRVSSVAVTFAVILLLGVSKIQAASVTSAGSITNDANSEVTSWRTDTVAKSFDLASQTDPADNVYGSRGYSIFRGDSGNGVAATWTTGLTEQQVLGLSLMQAGTLGGDDTLTLSVGNFNGAAEWDDPVSPGNMRNMGYAGPRKAGAGTIPAIPLTQAFIYKANLDFEGPIRLGIAADALADPRIALSTLRVVVGGSQANATLAATPNDGAPDMYFFDVANLSKGDTIEIQFAGGGGTSFSWPVIHGVTFDGPGISRPLTLQVNTVTGKMNLLNTSTLTEFDIDLLKITSEGDSLLPAGWNSLTDHDFEGSGAPNGTGNGWEELGTPNTGELAEAFLQGSSPIGTSATIDLGIGYNTATNAQDLSFIFRLSDGSIYSGLVDYISTPGVPGDYNSDGTVNAADYTVWRNNLGASVSLPNEGAGITSGTVTVEDYDYWKTQFGATSSSAGAASAVPEPPAVVVALLGIVVAGCLVKSRRMTAWLNTLVIPSIGVATVAWAVLGSTALAAVTNDREYWFGEDSLENASQDGIIGDSNSAPLAAGDSADSKGSLAGTYLDLTVAKDVTALNDPRYEDVGPSGLQRPGVSGQEFGARFDGENDYLTGIALNRPDGLENRTGGSYPLNYDGITSRGVQMWVYPDAAKIGTAPQTILIDSPIMGGPQISAAGNWTQANGGHSTDDEDGGIPDSVPVIGNTWYHVMQHVYNANDPNSPRRITGSSGTNHEAVLYVDGVAVSANFDNIPTATTDPLVVGAQQDGEGGFNSHFMGIIDDVEMYVFGDNTSQGGQDWGSFDLFADNEWIAMEIATTLPNGILKPGDVNKDGTIDSSDVDAFVDGWLSKNLLVGAHGTLTAGDWNTWNNGDMNHDGITDLDDAFILHDALVLAGAGGLEFSRLVAAVPEPSTIVIALLSLAGIGAFARRRNDC